MSSNVPDKNNKYYRILEPIIIEFNMHLREFDKILELTEDYETKIKSVCDKIKLDRENIIRMIEDLKQSIIFLESKNRKSKKSLFASGALGLFGVVGGLVTFNAISLLYGAATISNFVRGVLDVKNIYDSNKIIEDLKIILDIAIKQNQKMDDEISELAKKFKYKMVN